MLNAYVSDVNRGMGGRRRRPHIACCFSYQTDSEVRSESLHLITFMVALPLNFGWEMSQMYAYAGTAESSMKSVLFCGLSAVGDAGYAVAVYWLGSKLTRQKSWILHLNWVRAVSILLAGFLTAAVLEHIGLNVGAWQYKAVMIRIPVVGTGLWPELQLMLVPLLAFLLITLVVRRSTSSKDKS